jgi:hypothetical protein
MWCGILDGNSSSSTLLGMTVCFYPMESLSLMEIGYTGGWVTEDVGVRNAVVRRDYCNVRMRAMEVCYLFRRRIG